MAQVLVPALEEGSAEVAQVLVSALEKGVVESVPRIPNERLVFLLAREVVEDIRKVGEYRRMPHELRHSIGRFGAFITKLKALGDSGDNFESLRFLERLQLECMEKGVRLRLMMKETQLKISEKSNFILKLRGDVVV
nr:hypothetical protein [Tanacetum cinerariifolium]